MQNYLMETALLNFSEPSIQRLVSDKKWNELDDKQKILTIYNYIRDDIGFGYNKKDDLTASLILKDGYGQCNTKGTLFMALLRAVGVPCRIHGFFIDKHMQKGAITGIFYRLAPQEILHSWVEVYYNNKWLNLEGFILDVKYLGKLQQKFDCEGSFCGYGVATDNFKNPQIYWNENDTYIQKEGITKDLGVFDSPDDFYVKHNQKLNLIKRFLFEKIVRHIMNRNVSRIRENNAK